MTTSLQPSQATRDIMLATDLDETVIENVVRGFYAKVRRDPLLGPIFASRIADWEPHLQRMCAFWSSVALLTGRYHGQPMPAHLPLPVDAQHFDRWLALFQATVVSHCTGAGTAHLMERAQRIARSLELGIACANGAMPHGNERYRRQAHVAAGPTGAA